MAEGCALKIFLLLSVLFAILFIAAGLSADWGIAQRIFILSWAYVASLLALISLIIRLTFEDEEVLQSSKASHFQDHQEPPWGFGD